MCMAILVGDISLLVFSFSLSSFRTQPSGLVKKQSVLRQLPRWSKCALNRPNIGLRKLQRMRRSIEQIYELGNKWLAVHLVALVLTVFFFNRHGG